MTPITHAAVLQHWSLARKRTELARRLAEIRGVPLASTTVQQWENRSSIPQAWFDALATVAAQDFRPDITPETLEAAAQESRAEKRRMREAAQQRHHQPPASGG